MSLPIVTLAAEGIADLAILRRLVRDAKLTPGAEYDRKGKAHLDSRTQAYNDAAKFEPWVVARDMDHDEPCPGELVRRILPAPSKFMRYRIVVRSVEAWLLGDREKFAEVFSVAKKHIPADPEAIDQPKTSMLIALSKSGLREIRTATVRQDGNGLREPGPEYNAILSKFAEGAWRPGVAENVTPSLARARKRFRELSKFLRTEAIG